MKKVIALLAILLLSSCLTGCASGNVNVSTTAIPRTELKIVETKPLDLKPVHFHVVVENKKAHYVLDGQNFSNLAQNMEKVQNDIDMKRQQLEASKHYYDTLNK
jgi:hypothetical protein